MLSELQQILIGGLKVCGLNQDDIVAIMTILETEEQQWKMADYLETVIDAHPDRVKVLEKAVKLTRFGIL